MSVGFLLKGPEDAVIWRGPRKNGKLILFYRIKVILVTIMLIIPIEWGWEHLKSYVTNM